MGNQTAARTKRTYKRRESWGSIRQLPSGRFQASWVHEGARHTPGRLTFLTRQDARAYITQVHTDILRGVWKAPQDREPTPKFGEYAAKWVARRKNSQGAKLRPKTRSEYERQLRTTLAEFSDLKLPSITVDLVQDWYERRSDVAPYAAAAEARLLRAILGKAVQEEKLTRNPVPSDLTKSARRTKTQPTQEQLGHLYEAVPDRFKLGIRLAAWGGLRLSEWRALESRDFVLIGKQYHVRVERQAQFVTGFGWVVDDPKSEHGKRTQVLPSWMTPEIDAHLHSPKNQSSKGLVFPTKSDGYFHNKTFYKFWNAARDEVGVRSSIRAHDLRGFAGSHLMGTAQANLIEARDFLGHAESSTTEKFYIKKVSDRASELAEAMPIPWDILRRRELGLTEGSHAMDGGAV